MSFPKSKVTAIVSAYYARNYIDFHIENLINMNPMSDIIFVAQQGSYEYDRIRELVTKRGEAEDKIGLVTTVDIPTIYGAWNLAIRSVKTEYITNANCDDRMKPDSYALMQNYLDHHPEVGLVYGNSVIVDRYGVGVGALELPEEATYKKLLWECAIGPMPMWRKALHKEYGKFNSALKVCGDYDFWLRCTRSGVKMKNIGHVVGWYMQRNDSLEHRELAYSVWEAKRIQASYKRIDNAE